MPMSTIIQIVEIGGPPDRYSVTWALSTGPNRMPSVPTARCDLDHSQKFVVRFTVLTGMRIRPLYLWGKRPFK